MDLRSQVKSGFQEIESGQLSNDADISSKVKKETCLLVVAAWASWVCLHGM